MIFTLKHVKQPDVASGVPPKTKPLKKVQKIILKSYCVNVLSLDADIFYSFVVNGEVTFPRMCLHECSLHAA